MTSLRQWGDVPEECPAGADTWNSSTNSLISNQIGLAHLVDENGKGEAK